MLIRFMSDILCSFSRLFCRKKKKKRKEEKWGMIQNLFAGCDNCAEHTTPSHQHDSFSFGKARKALLRAMLR